MMVVGLTTGVLSAVWAERPATEGIGTLGTEAGAAIWFAGAVAMSLRTTTVRRALVTIATAVIGVALIAVALVAGWTGAPLALAMELGVGALAIVVIDVIVLGRIQPGLEALGETSAAQVEARIGWTWPPLSIRVPGPQERDR